MIRDSIHFAPVAISSSQMTSYKIKPSGDEKENIPESSVSSQELALLENSHPIPTPIPSHLPPFEEDYHNPGAESDDGSRSCVTGCSVIPLSLLH